MTTQQLRVFVPLFKVDAEKRLVYGRVADETPDFSGEVFDYASSKPHFEKWSGEIAKATDGKSLGNVRVMHTAVAAGKVVDIGYNDADKAIEVVTKCVDDDVWAKIEAGVYTGFSMGGRYVRKWKDGDKKRYEAQPCEISYVDSPCIPTATFEFGKGADAMELRKFTPWEPTAGEVAQEATELAKAAADGTAWIAHIEAARTSLIAKRAGRDEPVDAELLKAAEAEDDKKMPADNAKDGEAAADADKDPSGEDVKDKKVDGLAADDDKPADSAPAADKGDKKDKEDDKAEKARGEIAQVWQASDGKTFAKKADCVEHQISVNVADNPLTKAVAGLKSAVTGDVKEPDTLAKCIAAQPEGFDFAELSKSILAMDKRVVALGEGPNLLRKSVWDIGSFANAISTLGDIQRCLASETEWEKDGSKNPQMLRDAVAHLIDIFMLVAAEEMGEMLGMLPKGTITTDPTADPEVGVAVAQAAKAAKISTETLLEKVGRRNSGADQARIKAIHDHSVALGHQCSADEDAMKLAKFAGQEQELATLRKVVSDALPAIEQLQKQVKDLRDQPMPSAPRTDRLHVMEKGAQSDGLGDKEALEAQLAKMTPDQLAALAIKAAQNKPIAMHERGR